MTSEQLWRIKRLKWEKDNGNTWRTKTIFGYVTVYQHCEGFDWYTHCADGQNFPTLELAQRAADDWYRTRMASGLELVERVEVRP